MATQDELQKNFKALVKSGALGQAYALYGADVRAQLELAQGLAEFLEGDAGRPLVDALFIDGATQRLGVETMRQAGEFLYKMPVVSSRRTLVVSSAAELTREAQNSILKLVEEPPSHGLIILVLRDVNSLLPPLRSRLTALYVHSDGVAVTKSEIEERAEGLVKKFLGASGPERSKMIKAMVDEDSDIRDEIRNKPTALHDEFIVLVFTRVLIAELAKKPAQNARALKELLKRQSAMEDLSTNRRLQLEAALQFLP